MKSSMLTSLVLGAALLLPALATAAPQQMPRYHYKLKDVREVDGRQGVACDGKYIYVSDSKKLFKYDMQGKLVAKNENPFEGYTIPSNHIGDIDEPAPAFNGKHCHWTYFLIALTSHEGKDEDKDNGNK